MSDERKSRACRTMEIAATHRYLGEDYGKD